MKRIEKILSSGDIQAKTHMSFLYDITHIRFFTYRGQDQEGEYTLIGNIAEDISENNAIVNGKKCSVFDSDLLVGNKVVEHLD